MNIIFFAIVAIAFVTAGVRQINWALPAGDGKSPMEILAAAVINSAESSVTLALGLIGVMALFLGLMKVAEAGGLLVIIARLVRPLMQRLFPDVPPDHPAMGAMILNMSANVLGLGNAATPFGIRAMQELDKLNPVKGTASNAMVLFLAINTSSVTLLPTGVIALRAAAGSTDPAGIVPTTLFATVCSTAIAIIVAKLCQRLWLPNPNDALPADETEASITGDALDTGAAANDDLDTEGADRPYPAWLSYLVLAGILGLIPVTVLYGRQIAPWIIPGILVSLLGFGFSRRVRVYESFVEGAKDGFQVALRIIPYLVAILVAVGMFRASGAMEMLIRPLSLLTEPLGLPAEALPMALLRPLSGSGAYGILASIINDQAIGPDSYAGYLVSTLQGSTETTFYVLAVYFGAVQVRRIRHALIAGLSADVAGVIAAVFAVSLFLA
ncbi:MAG: spore maturation protein [Rhodospirillaceae bacterium]|jgi:spore maturation protein SpmA|nr:spore maturation protein [Rhodospirillaceae bacterium]MBT4117034.1 spore maturation protein [Rhodospirillaceae bacterium]MBT4672259.1 spore maturation protein [Rhodospirillaceae bacterium]MBT4721632.1 spore maturation protein [Rhodospirillaceae bacterium]MBT4749188.1 spore maturation protein [Rhodospirillaceae bacterium]